MELTSSIRTLPPDLESDVAEATELDLSRRLSELQAEAELFSLPAWETLVEKVRNRTNQELRVLVEGRPEGMLEARGTVKGLRFLLGVEESNRKEQAEIISRLDALERKDD